MRNKSAFIIGIFVALILITALSTLSKGAETEGIEGIWMGTLKVSVVELRIVFKINANADGTLAATMDSPDQGAENIAVSKVTFENGRLYLESKVIQGTYEGQIKEDGSIGGNTNYTIQELPKHNHLFQRAQTGAISEYAKIEETISPIALKAITQWILKQTSRANK